MPRERESILDEKKPVESYRTRRSFPAEEQERGVVHEEGTKACRRGGVSGLQERLGTPCSAGAPRVKSRVAGEATFEDRTDSQRVLCTHHTKELKCHPHIHRTPPMRYKQ